MGAPATSSQLRKPSPCPKWTCSDCRHARHHLRRSHQESRDISLHATVMVGQNHVLVMGGFSLEASNYFLPKEVPSLQQYGPWSPRYLLRRCQRRLGRTGTNVSDSSFGASPDWTTPRHPVRHEGRRKRPS